MAPPHRPKIPPPPQPTRVFFDPFNSSSTGHQRAENRLSGSTSWRESRTYKLSHQFRDATGRGGDGHLSDLVGAGSASYGKDGRKDNGDWEVGAPGLREKGWQDIRGLMTAGATREKRRGAEASDEARVEAAKRRKSSNETENDSSARPLPANSGAFWVVGPPASRQSEESLSELPSKESPQQNVEEEPEAPPQIFHHLNIYLNGSTAPLVSDHRLKHLISRHGGTTSIALGRRTVTHVVLGNTCGGGLASGKIQKEVTLVTGGRGGGKGVKFVTAEWVLDSVEKGIRQPEAKYVPKPLQNRIGGSGQASVRTMFQPTSA